MGRWGIGAVIVVLLCTVATGAWHYGRQFAADLRQERAAYAATDVPADDLAALDGVTEASGERLPVRLINTTPWHMTVVTLSFETTDRKQPLSAQITQRFDGSPWAPGAAIDRAVRLAGNWNGRQVHYSVISAVGFH
ncbi:MAG: hypothetical protein WAW96_01195 [Alphaproteobacteria bacterium]